MCFLEFLSLPSVRSHGTFPRSMASSLLALTIRNRAKTNHGNGFKIYHVLDKGSMVANAFFWKILHSTLRYSTRQLTQITKVPKQFPEKQMPIIIFLRANFSLHSSTILTVDGSLSRISVVEFFKKVNTLKCPVRDLAEW